MQIEAPIQKETYSLFCGGYPCGNIRVPLGNSQVTPRYPQGNPLGTPLVHRGYPRGTPNIKRKPFFVDFF